MSLAPAPLVLVAWLVATAPAVRAQQPCEPPAGVRAMHVSPGGDLAARPLLGPSTVDSIGVYGGWLHGRPGGLVAEHRHDGAEEMLWITCGELRLRLDGRDLDLVPGSAVRIPAGAPHSVEAGARGFVAVQVYRPGTPGLRFYGWPPAP